MMSKQYQVIKVALEIHEDDWNDDLEILVRRNGKLVQESNNELEVIEVSSNLNFGGEE
tara:strand:- start:2229 stop:2402 length:174 start_codon:yes stop_codon:yes gene_type:complete